MINMPNRLECDYHQLAEDIKEEIVRHTKCKQVDQIAFATALAGAFQAKATERLADAIEQVGRELRHDKD